MIRLLLAAALFLSAAPALAAIGDTPACIEARIEADAPASDCVNEGQRACFDHEEASPAATECFLDAKEEWGAAISTRMAEIAAKASDEVNQIAGIETRFDLMQNLLQCDRLEALSLVTSEPEEAIAFRRIRCEATATGLAYIKLLLQSRSIE